MSEHPSNYHRDAQFDERLLPNDEIELRELFSAIWAGKWLVIAITSVFVVASVALALYLPNIYKSEALLAPASSEQAGGLAGLAGQFGGLASLAGINLGGGGGVDKTTMAMEVMKSREFISHFVQKYELLAPLMAAKDWDANTNELVWDSDIYDSSAKQWVRAPKPPRGVEPSLQEAYEVFSEVLQVSQDKQTSLVKVSVEHYSPYIAKQWVEWLVESINQEMKARDLQEAQRSIAYLENQLAQTRVAEMQTVLYQLIEEQSKTMMFAEVRDEYVFKTVDPAIVPELKAKPSRALICVLGTMLGGMLAVFVVLIRHFARK
ncbi:lipopolysaccharide biosynthesis protein [Ferrimonas balearica DSM 9799]|uniref:Lipopolysaccharide biosynthesis protein n=1 Tax=Ferrimonas balearica (strain DSM 9799 / CCM 4581 / KCTC 23876 / PAT) TaxID=550540 RepID=E1SUT8_FERBD|nr:Wzz/FepE/Etk N-terminal domain-containing protein [Ferrimonas balearica]ADN75279.1 lipopolysaccharide biosynthesis protein [Ferrimonas balearica DSM 9799]